jgi:plastocyanin
MRKNLLFLLTTLSMLAVLLTACGGSAPEDTPTPEMPTDAPTETPQAIIPAVTVADQDASSGTVTVPEVTAAQLGWMVIHADADGSPGPVIGYTQVQEGENPNVTVDIDLDAATETLYAMLHLDAGTPGTYEFPGDDVPVKVDDSVVVKPFTVTLPEITPSVTVEDQDASSGTVTVPEVTAAQLGWMVIHADADGSPGPVIGYTQVQKGENANVTVDIDLDAATETLYAMLHLDAGTPGTYEFPGDDVPVKVDDSVVVKSFTVTLPETGMDEGSSNEVTVMIKDGSFLEKDITVKAGTTVTWIMDASFTHTVTADDGSFDSGNLTDGQTFSYTFNEVGDFPYYCTFHGGPGGVDMAGSVTVTE